LPLLSFESSSVEILELSGNLKYVEELTNFLPILGGKRTVGVGRMKQLSKATDGLRTEDPPADRASEPWPPCADPSLQERAQVRPLRATGSPASCGVMRPA